MALKDTGWVEIVKKRDSRNNLDKWLFLGSEDVGQWGAVLFSRIETCKLHHINPEAYLKDVLVRVSTTPMSQIDTLMPRLWRPPTPNIS